MRAFVFILSSLLVAQGPAPPAVSPKKATYQERRAELLRAIGELRSKMQALELELQLLDEERQNAPVEVAPAAGAGSWRESTVRPDGRREEQMIKKSPVRCAAFTANGKRCTRSAEAGSKFCWQHRH